MESYRILLFLCAATTGYATFCPRHIDQVEEGRDCRKQCETDNDCQKKKRCYCDGVCGMSCFNKESDCGEPDVIYYGNVVWDKTSWNGTAQYSCDEGYVLNGESLRKCHSDRKWSGSPPTCEQERELEEVTYCPPSFKYVEEGRRCRTPCKSHGDCSGRKGCYCDGLCGNSCFNKESECGEPDSIENGSVRRNRISWGGVALYYCNQGYFMNGDSERRCHSDKKWSGNAPTCEQGCTHPDDAERSFADSSDGFRTGEAYEFFCATGYYRIGNAMRTCMSDLQWSPAEYRCYPQQCNVIADVRHGNIMYTQGQNYGSIATLECDTGYVKSSTESMRCQNGRGETRYGEWEGNVATCTAIRCPEPPGPDHGSVDDYGISREFGDRVRYDCEVGYTLRGDSFGTCGEDGSWGARPTCIVDPDCDFNTYATPTCGYDNQNDRWTRTRATEPRGLEGYVIQISNSGNLKSPEIPVDWAENAICLKFYYKLERDYNKRVAKLKVQSTEPYRTAVYWTSHENEQSGIWLDAVINFSLDDAVQYQFTRIRGTVLMDELHVTDHECDDHCDPNPCQNGGTCVNRMITYTCFCAPNFVGAQCQTDERCFYPPRDIPNGRRVESSPQRYPDTTINYACDDGYKFAGYALTRRITVQCDWISIASGSRWSKNPNSLSCEEITCRRLVPMDHQQLVNEQDTWRVGDRVTYVCDAGYVFRDGAMATRRCNEDGLWTGTQPECIEPHCIYYETGRNQASPITRRDRYDVGDTVSFRCQRGYDLVGAHTLTCTRHQTWSGSNPTCQRVSCGIPPVAENEYRTTTTPHHFGDIYDVRCKQGYYLEGQSRITCQEDGSWTPHPVCKEIRACPEVEAPKHTTMQIMSESRKFTCTESLYELEGEKVITCNRNGSWSAAPPLCKEIAPTEKTTYEGIEYLVYAQRSLMSNFTDAKKMCGKIGANLAVLYTHQVRQNLEKILGHIPGKPVHLYIGLQRIRRYTGVASTRRFEWITDDIPTELPSTWNKADRHMHWQSGYPNIDGSDCGVIYKERGSFWWPEYRWQNLKCTEKRFFVCQRNYHPCVPNPCKHGGTCRENDQIYTCDCTMDYMGTTCAVEKTCRKLYPTYTYITEVNGERPTNQTTYRRHQSITFSCKDRTRVIAGQSTITCLPTGQWDSPAPNTCVKHCPMSDAPNNGHWSDVGSKRTFYIGDTLQFLCNRGFRFIGSVDTVVCQSSGAWGRINGFCADETACDPNPCQFGGICAPTESGHSCTCQEGFTGVNCEEGTPCRPPVLPDRAYISDKGDEFPPMTEVDIQCLDGYILTGGVARLTCKGTGRWSETDAACKADNCGHDPFLMPKGITIEGPFKGRYDVNERVRLICNAGGTPTADGTTEPVSTCQLGGRWLPRLNNFICDNIPSRAPCQPPVLPDRAKISDEREEFPPLTKVNIQCMDGYILTGNVTRLTCEETGRWSDTDAACKADNCRHDPFLMPNGITVEGQSKDKYNVNERLRLICSAGGTPNADGATEPVSTCQLGGRWLPSLNDFSCDN